MNDKKMVSSFHLCFLLCFLSAFVLFVAFVDVGLAADWKTKLPAADKVAQYLQDISVTIKAEGGEGSGVVKTRMVRDGDKENAVNFIWTAAHVVESLRTTDKVIDPATGTERTIVKFRTAHVVKELVEEGKRVGESKMDVDVIRISATEDIALLRVSKKNFVTASVVFYLDDGIPPIGTDLYHCGSLLGQMGSNSMTTGIISQIGRIVDKKEFDQTTATAFPGSSGGGLYLRNGAYVAMLVRGAGEGFNLGIPVRRLKRWAKEAGVLWALDDSLPAPTEQQLQKMPVEDTGVTWARTAEAGPVIPGTPTPAPKPSPTSASPERPLLLRPASEPTVKDARWLPLLK